MSRPLLITDCDEVLLHMVRHFGEWLDEAHDVDFSTNGGDFATALKRRPGGDPIVGQEVWELLGGFFTTQMARQTLVPGATDALQRIGEVADIVVLTNLHDCHQADRVAQLSALGIDHRVVCNQGGKGAAAARLLAEYRPSIAAFVDDLATHHHSVGKAAPFVHRLHMVMDPPLAAEIPPAPDAHARIDDWGVAADWILARFAEGRPAAGLTLGERSG
ncbi:hypothetical protein GGR88_002323 [Sphingomonas jejuensis]|uniref:HAD family hydrolase n=1 Tax=Sphingomonas jejuensis TaxID=904715 RepID=A0ABX0XPU3_9SPHN|nr:HAD family hydrolase [Sphingomonas jejuensis]NJC34809.1 hypothetical protein [Sphingomonas jejuensis]